MIERVLFSDVVFVFGFMLDRDSFFSSVGVYTTINPLVTAVIIGDYSDSTLPSITTAKKDYENIIHAFNVVHGYTVVIAQNCTNNDHNNLVSLTKAVPSGNLKLKWSNDEIDDFNQRIKKEFIDHDGANFDSLIYIVSCHGDGKGLIYDSNGEERALSSVYAQFDNAACRKLRNNPKIYLCDTYRMGTMSSVTGTFVDNNSNYKSNIEYGQVKEEKASISDIVVSQNERKPRANNVATYLQHTHYRKIFGNSAQQPISRKKHASGSLFIHSFTEIIKTSLSMNLTNLTNLTDILIKTRARMAGRVDPHHNRGVDSDAIVLSDDSTMPYEIEFGKRKNDHLNSNSILQQKVCDYLKVLLCVCCVEFATINNYNATWSFITGNYR